MRRFPSYSPPGRHEVVGVRKSKISHAPKISRPVAAILPRPLSKTDPLPESVTLPDPVAMGPVR